MICLSHDTAIKFWLNSKHNPTLYSKVDSKMLEKCCSFLPDIVADSSIINESKESGYLCSPYAQYKNVALHLLLPNKSKRQNYAKVNNHVSSSEMPRSVLYKISDDVLVVSPEFALLQTCASKTIPEIVKIACELNATFSAVDYEPASSDIDDTHIDQARFAGKLLQREPASSVESMNRLAESVVSFHGIKKFRRAVEHVPSGSAASPMEISLALLLSLPSGYGGFGLPKPKFNADVLLSEDAAGIYGHSKCVCDLLWEERKVDIEYNSDAMHANTVQMLRDSERALALECDGYRVVSVTKQQLFDRARAMRVACQVGKMLGRRVRIQRKDFDVLQMQLLHVLGLRK